MEIITNLYIRSAALEPRAGTLRPARMALVELGIDMPLSLMIRVDEMIE